MQIERKIEILSRLGLFFKAMQSQELSNPELEAEVQDFKIRIQQAKNHNGWFVETEVRKAIDAWAEALSEDKIRDWLSAYAFGSGGKQLGLILAGNIPLVGLHDVLVGLISEHQVRIKISSKDRLLMEGVLNALKQIAPEWEDAIQVDVPLKDLDYLIATGSDNSARYFDYYFNKVERLIRKNRTAVAVLNGKESESELAGLASDVFRYFGLGCRNVTKVFVPEGYDLDQLFAAFFPYKEIAENNKYANNYDYNKAVYLLNKIDLIENGFLLLKEDKAYHSPVGVLFYSHYEHLGEVEQELLSNGDHIQCVVSQEKLPFSVPFGQAQCPRLNDYADRVDTLEFLGAKLKG